MLSNGQILSNRFKILYQIGRGGTSSVYLAEDLSIGKKWAVKFLDIEKDDTGWLAQNEINMMIGLDYELFPRIVDAWQEGDGYVIVSDYIEGITLDKYLKKEIVNRSRMVQWWIDIAKGLRYLHSCNPAILYLDLKLENVMVKCDGSLKLIDFGIAGRIADRGSLYGTVGYAAPEQYYNRGELLDERTDIFAFGMLMYAMYTGKRPLKDYGEQYRLVCRSRRINKDVKSIILKCISEKKENRYRNVDELLLDLINLNGLKAKINQIKYLAIAGITAIVIVGSMAVKSVVIESQNDFAANLATELSDHIENGKYTAEGIQIILSYIDSGCLDDEVEEEFKYEVAKYYFENERNYCYAAKYFSQLDKEKYSDAVYYLELCNIQLSFASDMEQYLQCLDNFVVFNKGLGYTKQRFENDLMIAALYEGYADIYGDSQAKTIEVLKDGLNELKYADSADLYKDEGNVLMAEYNRRLCILYDNSGEYEKAIRCGENALASITDEREKSDIKKRIIEMKNK